MQTRNKPVVLLVAEAVTLAHFARIVTLAKALDPNAYDVVVASDPRYLGLEQDLRCVFRPIRSIPSAEFEQALARGRPLYSEETLTGYVEDDLALLDCVKPDLVVGDFRLSLAVSAPLRRIPYAAVVNAYWSPFAEVRYPVPDLPMTQILGVPLAQKLFDISRPIAFSLHAKPMNRVRRNYGLAPLGHDLRKVYTWGDYTLYADIPGLVKAHRLPPNHRYIGPVLWSTQTRLPGWWGSLPRDKPVVFVSLGSSGRADLLPMVIEALSGLPISLIVATAGKVQLGRALPNVFVADYLPMALAAERSAIVVSNGGSLTAYQALYAGVPVLGLCSNMDQMLNMTSLQERGAGIWLRASRAKPEAVRAAARSLLFDRAYADSAAGLRQVLEGYKTLSNFPTVVAGILRETPGREPGPASRPRMNV